MTPTPVQPTLENVNECIDFELLTIISVSPLVPIHTTPKSFGVTSGRASSVKTPNKKLPNQIQHDLATRCGSSLSKREQLKVSLLLLLLF